MITETITSTHNHSRLANIEAVSQLEWEDILTVITFKDQRFSQLPDLMKQWLATEGACLKPKLDEALRLARDNYTPEEAEEIIKSLILGCVLTEFRYDDEGTQMPFPKRKTEKISTADGSEIAAPSYNHALTVCIDNMKLGVNGRVAAASPIHDVAEDSILKSAEGEHIKGNDLLDIISTEFEQGKDICALVDAVTKFEKISEEMDRIIKSHCLYKNMLQRMEDKGIQGQMLENLKESVMKAISSMLKVNLSLLEYTKGDTEKYVTMVAEAYTLKGQDINNNLSTPGTKYPIRLRDRIFATYLRLMFSPLADEIMIKMAKNYGDDTIFDGLDAGRIVEAQSPDNRQRLKQGSIEFFQKQFGVLIKDKNINIGVPILYADEGHPSPVGQVMCFCSKSEIIGIRQGIEANNVSENLAEFIGEQPGDVHLEIFNGIIENISNLFGRDGIMIRVVKNEKDVLLIRIVEDLPVMAEYALKNRDQTRKAPEEKFILPNFVAPDEYGRIIQSLMTTRTLLLDPSMLLTDPDICIYVSEDNILSCSIDTPINVVCEKMGKNVSNTTPTPVSSDSRYQIYQI